MRGLGEPRRRLNKPPARKRARRQSRSKRLSSASFGRIIARELHGFKEMDGEVEFLLRVWRASYRVQMMLAFSKEGREKLRKSSPEVRFDSEPMAIGHPALMSLHPVARQRVKALIEDVTKNPAKGGKPISTEGRVFIVSALLCYFNWKSIKKLKWLWLARFLSLIELFGPVSLCVTMDGFFDGLRKAALASQLSGDHGPVVKCFQDSCHPVVRRKALKTPIENWWKTRVLTSKEAWVFAAAKLGCQCFLEWTKDIKDDQLRKSSCRVVLGGFARLKSMQKMADIGWLAGDLPDDKLIQLYTSG